MDLESKVDLILEKLTGIEVTARETAIRLEIECQDGIDREARLRKVERQQTIWMGAFGVVSGLLGMGLLIITAWFKSLIGGKN